MPKHPSGLWLGSEMNDAEFIYPRPDAIELAFTSQILARFRAESLLPYLTDAASLTDWRDESGNANNLGAGAAVPLFQTDGGPNSYPRVEFEATSSQYMVLASSPLTTALTGSDIPFTCIMVVNIESIAAGMALGLGHSTGQGLRCCGVTTLSDWRWLNRDDAAAGANVSGSGADYSVATWYVVSFVFPGTTISIYRSGTAAASATASNVGTATFDSLGVGGANAAGTFGTFFDGDITELIVFNSALGNTDRRFVEAVLGRKYAITLGA